jgi:hypothetical protein
MVRRLVTLVLAGLLGSAVLATGPATAADLDFATCSPTSTTGSATWTPPLTAASTSAAFNATVNATCTGAGDEAGAWTFSFSATSTTENGCIQGSGSGTVAATGPESFTSTFTYARFGWFVQVAIDAGGPEGSTGGFFLAGQGVPGDLCPASPSSLFSIGATGDTMTVPPTAASFSGTGTISPGLTFLLAFDSWTLQGTVTGIINGVPGSCTFSATFSDTGPDTMAASLGGAAGSGSCSGPGVSISCSFTVTRVATFLGLDGPCTGGTTLAARLALTFTTLNPTTSYNADGGMAIG